MINTKLKLGFLLSGLTLALALSIPVDAQTANAPLSNNSGTGQQAFCKRDFSNFLAIGIDFDGEGFWDYWGDILDIPGVGWSRYTANYCHFADIDSLLNRIDKLRKQLRQAFYVCDNVTTARLTAQYTEMSAELYYLRHFIDTKPFVSSDADGNVKDDNVILKPNFRQQFMQRMMNNGMSSDYANSLFNKFESKYAPKIEVYKNCTDPNMDLLRQKLKELANTLNTVKKLGQRFADITAKKAKQTQARVQANPGLLTVFSSTSASDFFRRAIDFRVNGSNIADPNYYDQLKQGIDITIQQNTPGTSAPVGNQVGVAAPSRTGVTLNQLQQDVLQTQSRDSNSNLEAIYYAELDTKYRQVSAVGLEQNLQILKNLASIINETTEKVFPDLKTCTQSILNKQCGG